MSEKKPHPVAYAVFAENGDVICLSIWREHPSLVALERNGHSVVTLAPIAQTDPAPTQYSDVVSDGGMDPRNDTAIEPSSGALLASVDLAGDRFEVPVAAWEAPAQNERNPTPADYLAARSALESCDWSNVPIGTKAILGRAVDLLWLAAQARPAQTEQQPVECLSEEAASTLRGMVEYCLNQRVCMGMDEGFKSFDPEEEHDFVKELRAFAEGAAPIAQTAPNSDCEWCAGAGKDHFGEKCEHCHAAPQPEQSQAATDVLTERRRQVEAEGWTPEHDDEHSNGEMALAAACYARAGSGVPMIADVPLLWPWTSSWWKPAGARRNLVKAAALILAEIERLDRAAARAGGDA